MYLDLRHWERAKELVEQFNQEQEARKASGAGGGDEDISLNMTDLLKRQAQWY